jgi:hypothetical protein
VTRALSVAALAAAALGEASAEAHEVGLSKGEYAMEGAALRAQVVFARKELITLVAGLDADGDGALTPAEVARSRDAIEGAFVGRIKVKGDGAACPGSLERAELTEQDGIALRAVYRCPKRPRELAVTLGFLDDLAFGHRHLARAGAGGAPVDQVLSQRSPGFTLAVTPEPEAPAAPDGGGARAPLQRGALRVGASPEAWLFLAGLFVSSTRPRAMAVAAAAFATALGLGLALGARGIWTPAPRVVAVAAALSVVYVGLDARSAPDGETRWRIALPFGVVHGLGCAAALGAGGALSTFALGVALGLAAMTALLLPAVAWARGRPAIRGRGARVIGAAIAALGVILLALTARA